MKKLVFVVGILAVLVMSVSFVLAAGGAPRVANLTGAAEVGGGDPDGSGWASITLNVGQQTVCWELSVSDIAPRIGSTYPQSTSRSKRWRCCTTFTTN